MPGMSEHATSQFCRLGWATLAGLILFGFCVWPTPFEFQTIRTVGFSQGRYAGARPREILCRVNRITGSVERIAESCDRDGNPAP